MQDILVTLDVLKFVTSIYSNSLHNSNNASIKVTCEVSKDINSTLLNSAQLLNMKFILFNFSSHVNVMVFSPNLLNFFLNINFSFFLPFNIFIFCSISSFTSFRALLLIICISFLCFIL